MLRSSRFASVCEQSGPADRAAVTSRAPRGTERPGMPIKEQLVKRFEDEIEILERELRTELPKEIQRARELGDLERERGVPGGQGTTAPGRSPDSDVEEARRRSPPVEPRQAARRQGRARIDVHVTDGGGDELVYRLVMPEDADPAKGLISPSSPIGRALLEQGAWRRGHRAGSQWRSPPRNRQARHGLRRPMTTRRVARA